MTTRKYSWRLAALFLSALLRANVYYVSPTGIDTDPGTIGQPFQTITKAVSVAVAGDTVYVRGGTYVLTATITLSKSGTSGARYRLLAFPGERPLLDF